MRTVLPSNPEASIDVLFRGATAEDVARWNKNEFKLTSGRVGADQVFCAGRFEEYVRWSEVLDAEKKVDKEMEKDTCQGWRTFEILGRVEYDGRSHSLEVFWHFVYIKACNWNHKYNIWKFITSGNPNATYDDRHLICARRSPL